MPPASRPASVSICAARRGVDCAARRGVDCAARRGDLGLDEGERVRTRGLGLAHVGRAQLLHEPLQVRRRRGRDGHVHPLALVDEAAGEPVLARYRLVSDHLVDRVSPPPGPLRAPGAGSRGARAGRGPRPARTIRDLPEHRPRDNGCARTGPCPLRDCASAPPGRGTCAASSAADLVVSAGPRVYCLTQSTCIVERCTGPRADSGNQSSWMQRCIGPGGRMSVRSVRHHCLPSRNVAMWVGVHSTAQLCHCVASTRTLARDLLLLLPVVQEDVRLLPGGVHHLHEVDLPAHREVLGVGPEQQQRVVRLVAGRGLDPALPPAVALARRPTPCRRCCRRVAGDRQDPVAHAHRLRRAPAVPGVAGAVVDAPRVAEARAVEVVDARRRAPALQHARAGVVPDRAAGGPARRGRCRRGGRSRAGRAEPNPGPPRGRRRRAVPRAGPARRARGRWVRRRWASAAPRGRPWGCSGRAGPPAVRPACAASSTTGSATAGGATARTASTTVPSTARAVTRSYRVGRTEVVSCAGPRSVYEPRPGAPPPLPLERHRR